MTLLGYFLETIHAFERYLRQIIQERKARIAAS